MQALMDFWHAKVDAFGRPSGLGAHHQSLQRLNRRAPGATPELEAAAPGSLHKRLAASAPRCDLLLMTLPNASAPGAATAATPCLTALLHLTNQPDDTQNGRSAIVPHSRVLVAFESELQRLQRLLGASYSELLSCIAEVGSQLPPTGSPDSDSSTKGSKQVSKASGTAQGADSTAASAAGSQHSAEQLAALEKHCHGLSADLLALDEFVRASVTALAQAAASYDAAAAAPATSTAAAAANGGRMRKGGAQKSAVLPPVVQLTAVCSHAARPAAAVGRAAAAAAGAGQRYTASLPQDAYHQAMYQLMAEHIGPGGSTDAVLWGLSVMYARLRHRQQALEQAAAAAHGGEGAAQVPEAEWRAPDRFVRNTTKYWVHPSDVLRLKLACARHLPVLVYGQASPVVAGDTSPEALHMQAAAATSLINSVYFDNPQLDVYHRRLRRDNDAQLVRLRWYGHADTSSSGSSGGSEDAESAAGQGVKEQQVVFVERKTHKEPWTGMRSVKERAPLPKPQPMGAVPAEGPAANGHASVELEGKKRKEAMKRQLLDDVQLYLTSLEQAPVLRTEYYRTAFQAYDSNDVRISMDTDMLMIREQQQQQQQQQQGQQGQLNGLQQAKGGGRGCMDSMCGAGASLHGCMGPLGLGDVVRFPYAVLEIKLQDQAPEWIKELKRSDLLVEVNGFSKFLHASALLYPDAVQASPPWFVPDAASRTMTPATLQEMADTSDKFEQEAASWLFPETSSSSSNDAAPGTAHGSPVAGHPTATGGISGWLRRMLPIGIAASAAPLTVPGQLHQLQPPQQQGQQGLHRLQEQEQGQQVQQVQQGQQGGRRQLERRGSSDSARALDSGSPRGTPSSRSSLITASVASSEAMQWVAHSQAPQQQQLQVLTGGGQQGGHLQEADGGQQLRQHGQQEQQEQQHGQREQREQQGKGVNGQQLPQQEQQGAQAQEQGQQQGRPSQHTLLGSDAARSAAAGCGLCVDMSGLSKVNSTSLLLPPGFKSHEQPATAQVLWLETDASKQGVGDIETGVPAAAAAAGAAESRQGGGKKRRGVAAVSMRLKTWLRRKKGDKQGPEEPNEHMTGMAGGPRANALVRTRIEPKTFFAAERTYLAWMHIAVLIMLTGLGLLTGATLAVNQKGQVDCDTACKASKISGTIITPVAIIFMAYGLFMYKKRSIQIMRRQTVRYDDQRGPVVLTLLLIAVTAVSLGLALRTLNGAGVTPAASVKGLSNGTLSGSGGSHHGLPGHAAAGVGAAAAGVGAAAAGVGGGAAAGNGGGGGVGDTSGVEASPVVSPGASPAASPEASPVLTSAFMDALGYNGAAG